MSLMEQFEAALALPPGERAAYLAGVSDQALRAQLEALLRVDARLDGMDSVTPRIDIGQWAAAISGAAIRPGDMIGPFRVCEPLGQGGMGVVFRGERDEPQQQVAIKIVRRGEYDALYRQRFDLERKALAALDHPYIARLLDANSLPDGTPYFVMEYVSGLPLDRYCSERRPSLRERVQLMIRIAQAVAHAHRHLIVHRDLKPGNVLIGEEGYPKLLDFGIAKRLDADAMNDTGTAQRFFSPRYAAPEQIRGAAASVGTDVYALGVLLFEVLAERAPFDFDGLSFGEIDRLIASVAAPAPSSRAERRETQRALRGDLDGIVQKCLRKSPDERYQTVAQLIDDLQAWQDGMPVRARGGHRWYRLRKFIARHRVAVGIAGASMLALSAAAVALWQQNRDLRLQRDVAQRALAIMRDAFTGADPIRAAGADITARQILESARRELEPIAEEQPELFATLAQTIASVDLSLGLNQQASSLLERARDAARQTGRIESEPTLALLHVRALMGARELKRAQSILDGLAAEHQEDPAWRSAQGRLWALAGDLPRSIAMLESAERRLRHRSASDELAIVTRHALADARGKSGDIDGELSDIENTLQWQQAQLAANHPQIVLTRMRRLIALLGAKRASEAVGEAQSLLHDVEHIFGAETAEAAYVYNTLGQALGSLGRDDDALTAFARAHTASSRAVGRDAPNTLRMLFNLAIAKQRAGEWASARQHFAELLTLSEQRSGGASPTVAYYRIYSANALLQDQQTAAALQTLTGVDWERGYAALSATNQAAYRKALGRAKSACDTSTSCATIERVIGP